VSVAGWLERLNAPFGGSAPREQRFGDLSAMIPPPGSVQMPYAAWGSPAALSVPAVHSAICLIAETLASFVMRVYEGDGTERQVELDAPQAGLFQDPGEGLTSFDLWSDTATSVEVDGNAFTYKVRDGRQVVELYPLPADVMCVRRERRGGPKIIEARFDGVTVNVTRDVIHTRGWSPIAAASGVNTLGLHERTLRGAMSLDEFRGRWFNSDATPNVVLSHPANMTPEQRTDARSSWNARHSGPYGDRVGVVWGGWEVKQLNASMQDAEASSLIDSDVREVARMFRIIPAGLLGAALEMDALPPAEVISDQFWRFTIMPRARRIERSFSADRDLFPDRRVYARFDPTDLLRGDIATTVSKIHQLKQVGMITANEGRAELGYPPSDDEHADELQATPVGGAPNVGDQLTIPVNGNGSGAMPELTPADSTA
jgi:HK97 family phage portal protein